MLKLFLAASLAIALLLPAAAAARPSENPNGIVTISQARSDANHLARRVTSLPFRVLSCRHFAGRPSAVTCRVRAEWNDEDGTRLVKRWTVTDIATRGGRWAEIRPFIYATGLVGA